MLTKSQQEKIQKDKLKLDQLLSSKTAMIAGNMREKGDPMKSHKKEKVKINEKKPTIQDDLECEDWEKEMNLSDICIKNLSEKMETVTISSDKPSISSPSPSPSYILRSPICCILGHVDTGKTKILDKVRETNVQEGEAGGITQQIGATFFPIQFLIDKIKFVDSSFLPQMPGLLIIDTPGHESFSNLRSRGSSICNIAILVVDIMHGLEPQTLESINILKQKKTPFIIALNKIDRLYGWQSKKEQNIQDIIKSQNASTQKEFLNRITQIITSFAEIGLNAALFYENDDIKRVISIVPTSAITGEGISDLLHLILSLTQKRMRSEILVSNEFECSVLEVKVTEGLGTTIDAILVNGTLREGDRIALCGINGPIITHVKSLLTPQPLKEMRVKGQYLYHKEIMGAMGIKIFAPDLDKAVAGSNLFLVNDVSQEETIKLKVMEDYNEMKGYLDSTGKGVSVQSSTLGSLEALLVFLKQMKIPVSNMAIGTIHKKDVIKASVMLEQNAKEYAIILAFDVKVDSEASELAVDLGVKIMYANIIYHLFDQFTSYMNNIIADRKKAISSKAVFPCILKIVPNCVFNTKDPLIMGIDITDGRLKIGTPVSALTTKGPVNLGIVTSIEVNHKTQQEIKRGGASAAIKIETTGTSESSKTFGRHFDENDLIVSRLTRQSIDVLKEHFRDDVSNEEWLVVKRLKVLLGIK